MLHLAFRNLDELIEKNEVRINGLIYKPTAIHHEISQDHSFNNYTYFFSKPGNYTIIQIDTGHMPEKYLKMLTKAHKFMYCCNGGQFAHKFSMATVDAKRVTEELTKKQNKK